MLLHPALAVDVSFSFFYPRVFVLLLTSYFLFLPDDVFAALSRMVSKFEMSRRHSAGTCVIHMLTGKMFVFGGAVSFPM